ncbi:hypothetical protein AJ80_01627 [Polytolypa hystricis UAMH7299]|uniref:Alpha box domain-containing protein n=1 Tax=Polytolypa hystricis (strain UAMH7299) TaxID=1447883 RepID=A0A2B7Z039_POLH7|nr:hypothetical protein AJ80_01627 [Polytolypa hystricis UAMH7299]
MAGNEVSGPHRAFNNFFTTLTPEQLQTFQTLLEEVNASNAAAATSNLAPTSALGNRSDIFRNLAQAPNMTAAIPMNPNTLPREMAPRGKRTRENGKLRPLNSFIAFRSFYSAAFPDLSQKVKSGLLRRLWSSDPFKAKWAILAKAYSTVRDDHTSKVTLESFLALNGPFIGIVAPGDYLGIMGLQLIVDNDKQFDIVQVNHQAGPTPEDLTTNLSVDDIIDHCYQTGYVNGIGSSKGSDKQGAGLAMAVSAQPNHSCPRQERVTRNQDYNTLQLFMPTPDPDTPREPMLAPGTQLQMLNYNVTVNTEVGSDANEGTPSMHDVAATTMQNAGASNGQNHTMAYASADLDQELRDVINSFPFAPEDNGYYGPFNPALRTPVVVYNPYRIQGDFDAFDIGHYVDL